MIHFSSKSFIKSSLMLLTTASVALAQLGCGEKSESAKVDFKPEESPIVVNANLTINAGDTEVTIDKPWFLYRYSIKNGSSDQTLYLVTFRFQVTGVKNGVATTKEYFLDPGEYCASDYFRPFLGIIPVNTTFYGNAEDTSNEPFSRCATAGNTPTLLTSSDPREGWYIDALPDSDTTVYSVQITGEGWFEDANGEITERLYVYGFQVTR